MLFSDASDLGFGAIYGSAWIQGSWSRWKVRPSIDYRELFAIVAAAETWGHNWEGKRIVFVTDNQPITQIWDKGSTPTPDIMSLIRTLFLSAAKRGYSVSLKFISGSSNKTADVLSRFQDREFRQLLPDADADPTLVPSHIWPTWELAHPWLSCNINLPNWWCILCHLPQEVNITRVTPSTWSSLAILAFRIFLCLRTI